MSCPVKYSRQTCKPFDLGIEGAQCVLVAGHTCNHVARIVDEFGDSETEETCRLFEFTVQCELCIDPINKPFIDESGAHRWRACPNPAMREILDEQGRVLNVCEEHFKKDAS